MIKGNLDAKYILNESKEFDDQANFS